VALNSQSKPGFASAARTRTRPRGWVRDVAPVWIALTLVTTMPYVLALLRTPPGHNFTGVMTAYDDTFTYFAWMKQAAGGRLLMCDLYTSEPQSCEFFLPLWIVLGFVCRVTHLPTPLVFHAARILSALLLLVMARSVIACVIKSRTRARWILWLYAFSGGLGWLVYLVKSRGNLFDAGLVTGSIDLSLPEAFAFRSAFAQVHFTLGAALVFAALRLFFDALVERRRRSAIWAGVMVTLLAVVHPYLVVVVGAVSAVMLLKWPWLEGGAKNLRASYRATALVAVWFAGSCAPGLVYLVYLNRSNKVLQEWLRITDTLSPSPIEYVLGFGPLSFLALIGLWMMIKRGNPGSMLIVVWFVVQALLLYAPVNFQRRFVEGLQLPLVIAASAALFRLTSRLRRHRVVKLAALSLTVLIASATNIAFLAGQIVARGAATGANDQRRYLPADFLTAADWLRQNVNLDDVTLCSYMSGNVLPGLTGRRVYLGHYGQTMNSAEKGRAVSSFFTGGMSNEEARRFITDNGIGYALFGTFEREISSSFSPPRGLKLQETIGDVEIYKFEPELR